MEVTLPFRDHGTWENVIHLVRSQPPLSLDEFTRRYHKCYANAERKPQVFTDYDTYVEFLKTLSDEDTPFFHNSCQGKQTCVCVHFIGEEGTQVAALYGYKLADVIGN